MPEQLISKKELLLKCDITYGQLYRWKRKNLIPDEWFIRKSTYTGQESFLPKDKVLKRIKDIQKYKNEYSLDELAKMFAEEGEAAENNVISDETLMNQWSRYFMNEVGETLLNEYPKQKAVYVGTILNDVLTKSIISMDELQDLKDFLLQNSKENKQAVLYICRKLGITFYLLVEQQTEIILDKSVKVLDTIQAEKLFMKEQ
ncbi:DUF4004 domain-containing protein [Staphylococcus condimenti]|uniref:DUF4004 family protein n=1 Tax=Staphylococcus condimenti TaxID=70255 RepID=A0AB37H1P6_9STAP|nr:MULTISPECIES: DUF4004 family protein [Staphylococcus]AMY06002.1 hypothetical protein A4G25_08690 [Staphylococcus condimenti]APR59866.1 hypothetical protein BTZ13_00980 [Staphylococcus condimenti]MDK8644994.1 DUF4004 family protein [Staphylococcus condimenti]OFP04405.1 hypothetical protein HMPREF3007_00075 [Staphylococcus sp. HMSC065E08]PNZ61895.1 DUF4004 domain-containing protein [Staphylococcus condimenti]